MDETSDNKTPLKQIPNDVKSIKSEAITDYCSFRNPWVTRQRFGEIRFAVKLRMPHWWKMVTFGNSTQEKFRAATQAGNEFNFMRVSEFNQVRVASILGCGPATHLGELKQDIEKEYKDRNEAKGGIEMVIKSDSITCNFNGDIMEAPYTP